MQIGWAAAGVELLVAAEGPELTEGMAVGEGAQDQALLGGEELVDHKVDRCDAGARLRVDLVNEGVQGSEVGQDPVLAVEEGEGVLHVGDALANLPDGLDGDRLRGLLLGGGELAGLGVEGEDVVAGAGLAGGEGGLQLRRPLQPLRELALRAAAAPPWPWFFEFELARCLVRESRAEWHGSARTRDGRSRQSRRY